jgi:hypothetical protein
MSHCYYCNIEAPLVENKRAMVCHLCNEIKADLSLQDFNTIAFISKEYSPERLKAIDKNVRALITLRRQKSARKAVVTKIANNTGWHNYYAALCLKATGKVLESFPMATDTGDVEQMMINIVTWSGGHLISTKNEGKVIPDGSGGWRRIPGRNNGLTDLSGGHPLIGELGIEYKNKYTKDVWKEYYTSGARKGQKHAQAIYRDKLIKGGGTHLIATDIEMFISWWKGKINL